MKRVWIGLLAVLGVALAADFAVMQPKELAARLHAGGPAPAILQVGPNVLYRSKHIPGSLYTGAGARPEGLEALRTAVGRMPRDREIVLYCGCCPWDHCPNVKPAMNLLKQMGFTRVKAMYIPTSFKTDWIDQGYPVEEGAAGK